MPGCHVMTRIHSGLLDQNVCVKQTTFDRPREKATVDPDIQARKVRTTRSCAGAALAVTRRSDGRLTGGKSALELL